MFFQPRIGQHYQEGFKGYRTLVLGVKHHCTLKYCCFYEDCVNQKNCTLYDAVCPAYGDRDDLRLSKSNQIEIDAFLEEYDRYPTYSYFTKLMLGKSDDCTETEKESFWEQVAFANYLQYFCPSPQVPEYEEDGSSYRIEDWESFLELLDALQPEVLLVWNSALKTLLDKKIAESEIKGLTHFDDFRSETLTINRYLYKVQPKATPENLFKVFQREFGADLNNSETARLMLNTLQKARFRQFVPAAELMITSAMVEWVNGSVWDDGLARYLVGMRQQEIGLDALVSPFESEIRRAIKDFHMASSFLLDFMETQAINLCDAQQELSWFELGKYCQPKDMDVAILYLTDTNDTFKSLLNALACDGFKKILAVVRAADSDKLLLDVTGCQGLQRITEKGNALLLEIGNMPCEKVGLVCDCTTLYLRRSNLARGLSLCPSDYMSSNMTIRELEALVYSVFKSSMVTVHTAKGERDLAELLGGLLHKGVVCRSGKRLKSVQGKAGQVLFYGLHLSGLSWSELEELFADDNIAKNANSKKVAKLLESDSPTVNYYRNLFGL
jgi:hypothetical protein